MECDQLCKEKISEEMETQHELQQQMEVTANDREKRMMSGASRSRKRHLPEDLAPGRHETLFNKATEQIIKLRVMSDRVIYDLKQRVGELEGVRERQAQNLIQQQMQIETLCTSVESEKRHREDLLNRVNNTRSICSLVEEHAEAAIVTLGRCEKDREVLAAAYERAADLIATCNRSAASLERDHAAELAVLKDKCDTTEQRRKECMQNLRSELQLRDQLATQLTERVSVEISLNALHVQQKEEALAQKAAAAAALQESVEQLRVLTTEHAILKSDMEEQNVNYDKILQEKNIACMDNEEEMKEMKCSLEENEKKRTALEETLVALKTKLEETEARLEAAEAFCKKQELETSEFKLKAALDTETKIKEIEKMIKEADEKQTKNACLQQKYEEVTTALNTLESTALAAEEKSKRDVEDMQNKMKEQIGEYTTLIESLVGEKRRLEDSASVARAQLEATEAQCRLAAGERARADSVVEQLRRESDVFNQLKAEKDMLQKQELQLTLDEMTKLKKLFEEKIDECQAYKEKVKTLEKEVQEKRAKKRTKSVPAKAPPKMESVLAENSTRHVVNTNSSGKVDKPTTENKDKTGQDSKMQWAILKPKQMAKRYDGPSEKDPFLSDSSFEGYVYDVDQVKKQYNQMVQRGLSTPWVGDTKKNKTSLFSKKTKEDEI